MSLIPIRYCYNRYLCPHLKPLYLRPQPIPHLQDLNALLYFQYTIHKAKKVHHGRVLLQEPSIKDIVLSQTKDKLLVHSKKYVKVYKAGSFHLLSTISDIAHPQSQHDIMSADFSCDGDRVVACKERSMGMCCSSRCGFS